jgi:CheY-like chemotaxis protein
MSIKVLVADDSITIQKVIGIIFGGDEYSLTVVDNGKAAVDKARETDPDILLIDALMPGMSGYEVAEAVRSTPSLAAKPILIMTGSFEPFDEEKAKKCGADDYIAKPFESQQIISKVKELLDLGSSRALSAHASQPIPDTEQQSDSNILGQETPKDSTPIHDDIPAQVSEMQAETPFTVAPTDIWGAFTPETETPVEAAEMPVIETPPTVIEPDVFAIVTEEVGAELVQNVTPEESQRDHTGSQWVPVEENTFEFEEETIVEPPQLADTEQTTPVLEPSFGDIAFEDEGTTPETPTHEAVHESSLSSLPEPDFSAPIQDFSASEPEFKPLVVPAMPFAPLADPTPSVTAQGVEAVPVVEVAPVTSVATEVAAIPATLTEEQIKTALASVSKEVIERIVWEVVPDLAEALIREAIRKIKEGV